MMITDMDGNTKKISCEDIYSLIIEILQEYEQKAEAQQANTLIASREQQNPFTDNNSAEESVETFEPVGELKAKLKQALENACEEINASELTRLLTMALQLKADAPGKQTKFSFSIADFVRFLKGFSNYMKQTASPKENLIQILEIENNREIVKPFAYKLYKILFYQQKPGTLNFYELSTMFNFVKVYFSEDAYLKQELKLAVYEYVTQIAQKYVCKTAVLMKKSQCLHFCSVIEKLINAFNGTIIELETEASDISKVLFTMLMFFLYKEDSMFMKLYDVKELFYCSLRSVYQGRQFAKQLECMILCKLKWKLASDNVEYTMDKVYQTIFKCEYRSLIGCVSLCRDDIYSRMKANESQAEMEIKDEKQRVLITKVIQTTPKLNKATEKFAFSPLSRRIGERIQRNEELNSKRKLRFDD